MMTSSNGNIFRVTGLLSGEFTGHRWIPCKRPMAWTFHVFFHMHPHKWLSKQWRRWWFETASRSLWRHCNYFFLFHGNIALTDSNYNHVIWLTGSCQHCMWLSLPLLQYIDDHALSPGNHVSLLCNEMKNQWYLGYILKKWSFWYSYGNGRSFVVILINISNSQKYRFYTKFGHSDQCTPWSGSPFANID